MGSLTSKNVPKTTSTFRALGAQTEKRMPSFVVPVSPVLLGAEAAVMGQVVALLLDGIAVPRPERERARPIGREGVADLGGDTPLVPPGRAVDDHAPAERPADLRLIQPDRGPVAGAAVLAGVFLHRDRGPVVGITAFPVPAPGEADVPEDRALQARGIDELHGDLRGRRTGRLGRLRLHRRRGCHSLTPPSTAWHAPAPG